ncbi:hypothetical protein [Azospirillum sp.]|uniref:hypothetical protein n=1 Tax=Azospirillum sp. TaxID=34012 RepID=UPI003D73A13F
MNAITALPTGMPISSGSCLDTLEQADDRAHSTGRYRKMERAIRDQRPDPAVMIFQCREKLAMHRNTAATMARVIRWFKHAPQDSTCSTAYGDISLPVARSEYQHARRAHHRVARQLGDWMRMAGAERIATTLQAAE